MRSYQGTKNDASNPIVQAFMNHAKTVFQLSIVVSVALYGYLLYGLFTGQMVNIPHMPAAEQHRIMDNIQSFSSYLNFSLFVLILTGIAIYYDTMALGVIFVALAAFMAYGLQYSMEALFASDASKYTQGKVSQMTLHELWFTGIMFAIPGIGLILYNMATRIVQAQNSEDLTAMSYGKDAKAEKRARPLIAVAAKCWQMPFCREGIRKECPIFHAKTKCWKERVGCMCEQNIIHLAMSTTIEKSKTATAGIGSGFVPLGDLLAEGNAAERKQMPTRVGPKGVKIPHNPHLSEGQKRERCRNCIIYNEHQRYKYQLLAPIVTLAAPLLVYLNFDSMRDLVTAAMNGLDGLMGRLSFSTSAHTVSALNKQVTGSLPTETIIIVCLTLILMTWALRMVEYCVFKLKI